MDVIWCKVVRQWFSAAEIDCRMIRAPRAGAVAAGHPCSFYKSRSTIIPTIISETKRLVRNTVIRSVVKHSWNTNANGARFIPCRTSWLFPDGADGLVKARDWLVGRQVCPWHGLLGCWLPACQPSRPFPSHSPFLLPLWQATATFNTASTL